MRRTLLGGAVAALLFALTVEAVARAALRLDTVRRALDRGTDEGRILARAGDLAYARAPLATSLPLTPDPALGWRVAPGAWTTHGEPVTVTDRGRVVPRGPAPARRTIVGLGDSFAFGDEVGDDHTWAAEVTRRVPDTEVVLLAHNGHGHAQNLVALRSHHGPADTVVLLLNAIDVQRNVERFGPWWMPHAHVDADGTLRVAPPPVADRESHIAHVLGRPVLPRLARMAWALAHPPTMADASALTIALLHGIADAARERGAALILVRTPVDDGDYAQLRLDPLPAPGARGSVVDAVAEPLCGRPGVRCVDAWPALAALARDGVPLVRTVHWTPAAQAAVGGVVAEAVDRTQ